MRTPLASCLILLLAASLSSASLENARLRWLKGNYEEAQEQYEKLLKDAKTRGPAAVGLSCAHVSQGHYDKALEVVEDALKELPKDADLLARRAELLHFRGRWDEAGKAADAALAAKSSHVLARWVKAQLFRDRGEVKKAEQAVKGILDLYNDTVNTPNEIKDPESLVLVGLACAEDARWNAVSEQFSTILEDMYGDAIKFDKAYWPAELNAGLLLLEKYNRGEALAALDNALKINPSAAEALVAKGVAALQRFEFKDAESFAERALKINANLPEALRLRADVFLGTGDIASAKKELARARKISPRDERTLARLAGCELLSNNKAGFDELLAEVEKFDSKPAQFYFELGEQLEQRRRYDLVEQYYSQATKLRPNLPGPLNGLGMLYMRLGKEAEAAPLLEKGFQADKFNVRVKNMRTVLRHLQAYKDVKTKHFLLRHDAKADPVLARYMADQLELVYEELARKFNYRPEGPILVELFRTHEMFSGRTVALPDLHTIGACTGRVITMVSPNEKTTKGEPARKPFNWMRVIRHELVHIFNLAQTSYMVPHWFTEGLAVSNEGFPRPPSWNQLLVQRYQADKLLNLDTIDLGFIRPRDPLEWQQAYLQAQLYVEYIEKTHGAAAIGKMLAEFARGKGAVEAIRAVCKVDKEAFEKGYKAYLGTVVKKVRGTKPVEKRRSLEELQQAVKDNPADADAAAELALRLLPTKRAEARKLAEQATETKKDHPRALYVLAQLAKRAADTKQEKALLERALDRKDPEPLVLKALGKIYYDASDFEKAAELFEMGRKADPYDKDWLLELARVYAQTNDKAKQISVLRDLVPLDADDLDRRVRLAKLLSEAGKVSDAERFAREALQIDITSKEARELLFEALRVQKKDDELKKVKGLLE